MIRVISAQLDPEAAGFPLQMYVAATLGRHDPRTTRLFEDHIRSVPQIITADNVTGDLDYLLTVVARDVAELRDVLANLSTRGGQLLCRRRFDPRRRGCWSRLHRPPQWSWM